MLSCIQCHEELADDADLNTHLAVKHPVYVQTCFTQIELELLDMFSITGMATFAAVQAKHPFTQIIASELAQSLLHATEQRYNTLYKKDQAAVTEALARLPEKLVALCQPS